MRGRASLLPALAASAALHAAGGVLADALLGGAIPEPAGLVSAARRPHFHAILAGAVPQPAPPRPALLQAQADGHAAGRAPLDLPLPYYFSPSELDRKPEAVGEIPLDYPAHLPLVARSRIVLSLLIDERGEVDKVIVEANDAPPELEKLASRAFAGARFTPGLRNGAAVKSRLRVEVTFESG